MAAEQILVSLVVLFLRSVFIYLTTMQAEKKGRDAASWAVLGFMFGFFALVVCYFLKPAKTTPKVAENG